MNSTRLYREDIQGSLAHARMLGDCGVISAEDAAAIREGLQGILRDIEAGKVEFTADNEDIHMNVEALLTARIGDAVSIGGTVQDGSGNVIIGG